jgi:4-hydroxyphenylacetate 3-monooxygenase
MSTDTQQLNAVRPYTGAEYLESLRDGREVWIHGERVKDVTTHPAFRNSARSMARMYDALHEKANDGVLTVPTDTGNGGFTHPFFKVPYTRDDLRTARDAITRWQELAFGFMGRSPDYKASFLGTLGANIEFYDPYQENARRWYKDSQERVLYLNHAIVNPPVDRHRPPDEVSDVFVHVVDENDNGIVVSGAKVVATNSALTHFNFIAHLGAPLTKKEYGVVFMAPMNTSGVKLLARQSYEFQAAAVGSPFDYPLSSRLDENDAIIVFDKALIPWENVLAYDAERANTFMLGSGMLERAGFQGVVRLTVKLGFLAGLLHKAVLLNGTNDTQTAQTAVGELLMWRNLFAGIADGMIEAAEPWNNGAIQPGGAYGLAYLVMAPQAYVRIKQIIEETVGSSLIYLNSNAVDFKTPELRPYLDQYLRGSHGATAEDRVKLMKLFWDAVGSEFGSRHELYEINYAASGVTNRMRTLWAAQGSGLLEECAGLVDKCMSEYNLDGWTTPDFVNPTDVNLFTRGEAS